MSVLSAERVRRLSLGVPVVDDVFPGFESGDFAVLYGDDALLVSFVCVSAVFCLGIWAVWVRMWFLLTAVTLFLLT